MGNLGLGLSLMGRRVQQGANSNYYLGVEWDPTLGGIIMTRVGNADYLAKNPIFGSCKPVLLNDNGIENGDLATWALPTLTGDLTGVSGQVMLRIPKIYYKEKLNAGGELCGLYISEIPQAGFKLHEKFSWGNGRDFIYVGLFEGYLNGTKLSSITGFVPTASRNIAQYRADAVARGTGWHGYDYYTHHLLQMLFYVYYANLNSQLVLPGYTEHNWADAVRRATGRMNGLATVHGSVNANEAGADADLVGGWYGASRVIGNRFLWVENIFGHLWKFIDGCAFDGRTGQPNTAYLTPDPRLFSSVDASIFANYVNQNVDLPAATNENYIQSMGSLFLPKKHGGSSSTFVTDYFWSYLDDVTRNYLRVVVVGGGLDYSGLAGVAARHSSFDFGSAGAGNVSRLCYEKI